SGDDAVDLAFSEAYFAFQMTQKKA
ncbi:MAG: hypothetical protein RLY65_1193, partial [Pseudomonadota bacterium]